jgi:hypothetical protein
VTSIFRVLLKVAVTDGAIALRSFLDAVTAAIAVGRLAAGDTGTVAGTAQAVLARIADTVVVAGCRGLAGRVGAAVGICTVGGAIAVIVYAVSA